MEDRGAVRWEKFLPRAFVGVLLVESDHSTREIVASLLRKCGYRVSIAADGVKAWEIIKQKPQEIDLVLTEVDLPRRSGLCLLTMIMKHESCRNIPVIMMSSHDNLNMVFEYMQTGATDFLVKPLRKNELRNLWQHVWRRCMSNCDSGDRGANVVLNLLPQKYEDDKEDNADSSHSSENLAYSRGKKESSCKGSDTQNSCTRQSDEARSTCVQNDMHLQSSGRETRIHGGLECLKLTDAIHGHDDIRFRGNHVDQIPEVSSRDQESREHIHEENHANSGVNYQKSISQMASNDTCQTEGRSVSQLKHSVEIADLLGTMDGKAKQVPKSGDDDNIQDILKEYTYFIEDSDQLNLSLRRYQPKNHHGIDNMGCNILSHSNSSAFARYSSKAPETTFLTSSNYIVRQDGVSNSDKHLQINKDACDPQSEAAESTVISVSSQDGKDVHYTHAGDAPPFATELYNNPFAGFAFSLQPLDSIQLGPPPWRTNPTIQKAVPINLKNPRTKVINMDQSFSPRNRSDEAEIYQTENVLQQKSKSTEDLRTLSSVTDQNVCSSSGSGRDDMKSSGAARFFNANEDSFPNIHLNRTIEESHKADTVAQDIITLTRSHRSIEREAALTKFRLKRKDRCFEKKVRYHSRQKLAEQRPRVKGQFVRQAQPDCESCTQVDVRKGEAVAT